MYKTLYGLKVYVPKFECRTNSLMSVVFVVDGAAMAPNAVGLLPGNTRFGGTVVTSMQSTAWGAG